MRKLFFILGVVVLSLIALNVFVEALNELPPNFGPSPCNDQAICLPGSSSIVTDPIQTCGGEDNPNRCYCADLLHSNSDCGACSHACTGDSWCEQGVCTTFNPCPPGMLKLGAKPCADNCCWANDTCNPDALQEDNYSYGTCWPSPYTILCGNKVCKSDGKCADASNSICCDAGEDYCEHTCFEKSSTHECNGPAGCTTLSEDPSNCGSCGNTCSNNEACFLGKCVSVSAGIGICPEDQILLNGNCSSPCPNQVVCIPGSKSPVKNLIKSCGMNNLGGCYCADNCTNTSINTNCDGCIMGSKCLSSGMRSGGEYCSPDKDLLDQKNENESCDNSFECSSNVCVSGKCVSASLIQKIIDWFKNLFGAK